jgi:hypothetical protein
MFLGRSIMAQIGFSHHGNKTSPVNSPPTAFYYYFCASKPPISHHTKASPILFQLASNGQQPISPARKSVTKKKQTSPFELTTSIFRVAAAGIFSPLLAIQNLLNFFFWLVFPLEVKFQGIWGLPLNQTLEKYA